MITVIKQGKKKQAVCDNCGAILEYENCDIEKVQVHANEHSHEITCPCCKNMISV